jgi:hypothetical protein
MDKEKNIHGMELHERIYLNVALNVLRVPGGWIYCWFDNNLYHSMFVPYNNEFSPFNNEVTQ